MQRTVEQIVQEGSDGAVEMRLLATVMAVWPGQSVAAIEAVGFGEMAIYQLISLGFARLR